MHAIRRKLAEVLPLTSSVRFSCNKRFTTGSNDDGAGVGLLAGDAAQCVEASDAETRSLVLRSLILQTDFLSVHEEQSLLDELEPYMKRLRYEFDHWDNAIHGYRETERLAWSAANKRILERVKQFAFDSFPDTMADSPNLLNHVHVLDLHEMGHIKPHVDAVRFCGNTIAGLSLLSDAVMRFVHEKNKTQQATALLKRRSLYIMRNEMRYNFSHEILKNEESYFRQEHVPKKRRLSIICRNQPNLELHPEQ